MYLQIASHSTQPNWPEVQIDCFSVKSPQDLHRTNVPRHHRCSGSEKASQNSAQNNVIFWCIFINSTARARFWTIEMISRVRGGLSGRARANQRLMMKGPLSRQQQVIVKFWLLFSVLLYPKGRGTCCRKTHSHAVEATQTPTGGCLIPCD